MSRPNRLPLSDTVCVKALELRDGVKADYMGKGVSKAVENVNTVIGPALVGMAPSEQKAIDEKMVQVRQRSASKRTCLAPTNVCRSSMEARTTGAGRSRVGPLRIEMHVTACCLPTHDLASCAQSWVRTRSSACRWPCARPAPPRRTCHCTSTLPSSRATQQIRCACRYLPST